MLSSWLFTVRKAFDLVNQKILQKKKKKKRPENNLIYRQRYLNTILTTRSSAMRAWKWHINIPLRNSYHVQSASRVDTRPSLNDVLLPVSPTSTHRDYLLMMALLLNWANDKTKHAGIYNILDHVSKYIRKNNIAQPKTDKWLALLFCLYCPHAFRIILSSLFYRLTVV